MSANPLIKSQTLGDALIAHPADATVFAPDLPRRFDGHRAPWTLPDGKKLAVSILLHAPSYQDVVPEGSIKPTAMQGGVGRETSEPLHGQVARLSQWDFGLTVGIWRLLDIAKNAGVPVAVALDSYGVRTAPGLATLVAERADEIVARGSAANIIIGESMTREQELAYILESKATVERATGRAASGWFGPERGASARTTGLLREAGFDWFGDWAVDERPVQLDATSTGLTAVPFSLETEDMFALYGRSMRFQDYELLLEETIDQLIADADVVGARHLGLSWFGWVLGQACFADVAERTLEKLAANPAVLLTTPGGVAALGTSAPAQ
jgi:peptidoglycan/xylan/chitin deacetylase (PgdA/CDA1 family)